MAAATADFSNKARRASSGRMLPASTMSEPASVPASSRGFSAAALTRLPAATRTILRPPNIGMVCSSTASRSGSRSRSASSRRTISPAGVSRSESRRARSLARSATRPTSVPKNRMALRRGSGEVRKLSADWALMATMMQTRYGGCGLANRDALRPCRPTDEPPAGPSTPRRASWRRDSPHPRARAHSSRST